MTLLLLATTQEKDKPTNRHATKFKPFKVLCRKRVENYKRKRRSRMMEEVLPRLADLRASSE